MVEPSPRRSFDVYMIGVGGQGIGLLSEALLRAVWYSGQEARGVDTHGLAQRGGTVKSQLRIGPQARTPLIRAHAAQLVLALERYEALRGLHSHGAAGGTLVWYDAVWQPLAVRMRQEPPLAAAEVERACRQRGLTPLKVFEERLDDARMQNVAVLGTLARARLLPGVAGEHLRRALADLLAGPAQAANLALFDRLAS